MVKILWVDDEVELLKPHVLFLTQKGYEVDTCNNGYDAIDMASEGGLRPDHPRRDDARHDRTRNPAQDQGGAPDDARHHGHQERRGEHHGQGRGIEDRRLPHQAREPQPGAAVDQEERPPAAARHRADHGRLPRRSSGASPSSLQMAENVLRTGATIYRRHHRRGRSSLSESIGRGASSEVLSATRTSEANQEFCEIRAPQLLQLDQPPHGRHARRCRIRSCARASSPWPTRIPRRRCC